MMSSDAFRAAFDGPRSSPLLGLASHVAIAQSGRTTPKFYPDDPLQPTTTCSLDASGFADVELSEAWDFLINTFTSPGEKRDMRAVNVNTLDEVPDSSWFMNRIGVRDLPLDEIVRGPNKFANLDDVKDWTLVRGKNPGGFQPGFRAVARWGSRAGVSARGRPAEASADGQRCRIHRDADSTTPSGITSSTSTPSRSTRRRSRSQTARPFAMPRASAGSTGRTWRPSSAWPVATRMAW